MVVIGGSRIGAAFTACRENEARTSLSLPEWSLSHQHPFEFAPPVLAFKLVRTRVLGRAAHCMQLIALALQLTTWWQHPTINVHAWWLIQLPSMCCAPHKVLAARFAVVGLRRLPRDLYW